MIWKPTNGPVPRSAVLLSCIDKFGFILIIHRSNLVRSAKTSWGLPSGLHDIGETLGSCSSRELLEEFNVAVKPENWTLVDAYENIAGDPDAIEQWHWNLHVMVAEVDYADFENVEPDKHDDYQLVPLDRFPAMVEQLNFHPAFKSWFALHGHKLMRAFQSIVA